MVRRTEIKGVARNLAHKLTSRNNDYSGYWAAGKLYLLAEQMTVDSISINLLELQSKTLDESFTLYTKNIQHFFYEMLAAQRIPLSWIKSADVIFSFNEAYQNKYHKWRSALGVPYLVTLEITTDLGKIYKQVFGGNVNPHDPRKEQRRAGFEQNH